MPFGALMTGESHWCVGLSAMIVNILYPNMPEAQSVKLNGFMKHNLILVTNFLGVDPKI